MRKTVPMRIGELWGDFLKSSPGVARKMAEARVAEVWPAIVGPAVAASTLSINVANGLIEVKVSSSVIRHELFLRREALRDALNEAVGIKVLNVVIIK